MSHHVIFDTVTNSRKHRNLQRDGRVSMVFAGPDEQTLQLEGVAQPVTLAGKTDEAFREIYYETWPDGRDRALWPSIAYWRVHPLWARYSDYGAGPLIREFDWR